MTIPDDKNSAGQLDPDTKARLISLYKKFVWADGLRREYQRVYARDQEFISSGLAQKTIGSFEEAFESDMYMCLWFSVLYVVIEGWPALRMRYDQLTPLLRSPNKELLKDFRDANFHPTDRRDDRLDALVQKGKESYEWVVEVTNAFREFFKPVAQTDRAARRRSTLSKARARLVDPFHCLS